MTFSDAIPAQVHEDDADSRDPRALLKHKADLAHLPGEKRCQLEEIDDRIPSRPPRLAILFGSYARRQSKSVFLENSVKQRLLSIIVRKTFLKLKPCRDGGFGVNSESRNERKATGKEGKAS